MPLFKERFMWSNREVDIYWEAIEILLLNEDFKKEVARIFGLENKERKLLGLDNIEKPKKLKTKVPDNQTRLF
jgi:hypothetical protein